MELAREQQAALDAILAWHGEAREKGYAAEPFVLCGYAGTGKTTLMNFLLDEIGGATCATMTGKAMNVLKRKVGDKAKCRTIHNLLYKPTGYQERELVEKREGLAQAVHAEQDPNRVSEMLREISTLDAKLNALSFTRNEEEEGSAGLIVVDEASMLSKHVLDDLVDLGRPVLLVGDDMQLPPVQGKSVFEQLGVDARLTEVHRQALESPILALATAIRQGDQAVVDSWRKFPFDAGMAARADKVLCYMNKTRHNINRMLRQAHGFSGDFPVKGDKLICTHNVRGYSMINGGEAVATSDFATEQVRGKTLGHGEIRYEDNDPAEFRVSLEQFAKHYLDPDRNREHRARIDELTVPRMDDRFGDVRFFDYGYAVTVHKAQGSEYEKVFLYDDAAWLAKKPGGKTQRQRWLYTAVTRAKEKLAWVR